MNLDNLVADQGGGNHFHHFRTLVDRARQTNPDGQFRILEVGTWAGNSLIAWARAAPDAYLTVVDPWQPYMPSSSRYPHYAAMNNAAASGAIEELFWQNMEGAGINLDRLTVWKKNSVEWLPKLHPDHDIVFIDGDHRYSVVSQDIRNGMALVRPGGILCGDDLDQQLDELDRSEHEKLMAIDEEVATTASGLTYHHGVVQAVYENFGHVTCFERRLWAVHRHSHWAAA
jgi:predicted O-methyltransferase YrrM